MTVRIYLNTSSKRAETTALLDTGATENFMSLNYAQRMRLPTMALETPRKVFNVDSSENKAGTITHYTDLSVQTGQRRTLLRFFLTNIGGQDIILGYPWFMAIEPKIVWGRGWIDYTHLPIVMRTHDARLARMVARTVQRRKPLRTRLAQAQDRQTLASKLAEQAQPKIVALPERYKRHARVFSEEESQRFPPARPWDHAIELSEGAPKTMPGKIYALTQAEQKAMEDFLKEHLKKGYIRPSKSRYAAPFFFVKKKDGKLRPVQDYRKLNEWTIRNTYPLPLIPELIARVKGAALFSKFDVRWGYNNIRIKQGDEWKAAFVTNKGLFEPKVMFFGLTNSPATFQTMMNAIFKEELCEDWLTIYMDDILIHTKDDVEYHRGKVHHILDKLQKNDLFLKPEKCSFEQTEMEFLGVILGPGTIRMDPAKLKGIADWSPPRTVKGVRAFLGFTGFYRYFIPGYSQIARPLIDLTKKDTPWHWWEPQMKAFETLKTLMC
jgi:Reverse transcriptase (RNA-dependent DNA polymerase)